MGNVYITGTFDAATLTLGGVTLNRIGNRDTFVAKLDASGATLWAKNFGGSGARTDKPSIAVDTNGSNVYVGGSFGSASLTTPALAKIGNGDAFAVKLDASGATLWAKNFGGNGAGASGRAIAVDSNGNVYLGGYFGGASLDTPALAKIGEVDSFAIKLNAQGATTWAKNFGGSSGNANARGEAIAVDTVGNVYLGGFFYNASLTTPTLGKIGNTDAFALKLDASGTTTWAKNFGGSSGNVFAEGKAIAVDTNGNVYLSGSFSSASLTTPALTKIGFTDAFAIKLDAAGTTTWAKNFGGIGNGAGVSAQAIAVDASGSVYLGGGFIGNLTTPALTPIGKGDAFAIKLDTLGATTWSKNFGGSGASAAGNTIVVDGGGNIYLGGLFEDDNLTTPALTKIGRTDAFILKQATVLTYSVTYSANAGTGGSVPVDGAVYANGATVTVRGNTAALTRTGFDFAGWNSAANGSGTAYAGGATLTMGAANVILYAQWTLTPPPPPPPLTSTPTSTPTLSQLPVSVGGVSLPLIFNLNNSASPALLADIVSLASASLNAPLRFVEQTASGSVVLGGFNGGNISFLPLSLQAGDARTNGIYPLGNGQFTVVSNGASLSMAPALVNLEQLSALLPGLAATVNDNGSITANFNGLTYVVLPNFAVQLRAPTGVAQLSTDSDGTLRFTDASGNSQTLGAAFQEPATARGILQGLDAASSLSIQPDGTAAIVLNGLRATLVPDLTLGGVPAGREGQSYWFEGQGPSRYRLRHLQLLGTTQGLTLR